MSHLVQLCCIFNKGFIDTDDIIRAAYDCDLSSIIAKYGHDDFLKIYKFFLSHHVP